MACARKYWYERFVLYDKIILPGNIEKTEIYGWRTIAKILADCHRNKNI